MSVTIKMNHMRNGVYFFFAFCLLLGLLLLGCSIHELLSVVEMAGLLNEKIMRDTAILLLVPATMTVILAFIGLAAVRFECRKILIWISVTFVLVFIMDVAAGLSVFTNREDVSQQLESGIQSAISTSYGQRFPRSSRVTAAMDWIQQNFECCGGVNASDWANSPWYKSSSQVGNEIVPRSCCKEVTQGCNKGKNAKTLVETNIIHGEGCLAPADSYIKQNFKHSGNLVLLVGFLLLIGQFLLFDLTRKLKDLKRTDPGNVAAATDPTPLLRPPAGHCMTI